MMKSETEVTENLHNGGSDASLETTTYSVATKYANKYEY